jgi:glycosyltransferase involved in cell wall biosynthesis
MRIALISESPTMATGFARTTRTLAGSLSAAGHEVVCYGIGVFGESFDRAAYPYRIWAAGLITDDVHSHFGVFLQAEEPEALIINYDLITVLVWLRQLDALRLATPIICHLVVDGLPVDQPFLDPFSRCQGLIVPSARAADYIRQRVRCPVHHFPHLVDAGEFFPAPHPRLSDGKDFVVGCIAQNRPRKQLQQLLLAISQLRSEGFNCSLRLHTDRLNATRHGGDNLRSVVRALSLQDAISATEYGDCTDISSNGLSSSHIAEIIRECSCMVVAPTCGGFEYGIVEAQACGVPVLVTNDASILEEVCGSAAYLLAPALFEYTSYGARAFRVPAAEIAHGIRAVCETPALGASLIDAGRRNAKNYDLIERRPEFATIFSNLLTVHPANHENTTAHQLERLGQHRRHAAICGI